MLIEERFTVAAPRERVAAYLLDVERVAGCVPGVGEVSDAGDGRYKATLRVQLGPIRAQFTGDVTVDGSAAPDRLVASGQGRDRQTGSQAKVEFTADLSDTDDGHTEVASRADVVIRGRLGQFGTGVISSTATSMVRAFADCASQTLAAEAVDPAAVPEGDVPAADQPSATGIPDRQPEGPVGRTRAQARPSPVRQPSLGRVLGRGLLIYLARLWTRLRHRGRPGGER